MSAPTRCSRLVGIAWRRCPVRLPGLQAPGWQGAHRCRCRRQCSTATASTVPPSDQLSQVAARLSTVRCRELLAAACVELLRAGLVGSAGAAADAAAAAHQGQGGGSEGQEGVSPEALLESLHATLQASLQDSAHQIAPQHHAAWGDSQWEAWQETHAAVQHLLFGLHTQAARAGSAAAALQVARCQEHGLLVPQDHPAAFAQYKRAAAMGSAEGCLRLGIHYFEGTAPGGRDGAQAFDCLSQALDLANSSGSDSSRQGGGSQGGAGGSEESADLLPPLAPCPPDMVAADGDVPAPLTADEVRYSALTWMGRCYQEGAGVERSVAQAAACFRQAGNSAELEQLAALKREFEGLELAGL